MANIVKIKRSITNSTPSSLAEGELAYSEVSKNLFIGTNGGANIEVIGGKTAIDKLAGIESGAQANTVTSVAGKTGAVSVTKSDIGFVESDYVHVTGNETIAGVKTFTGDVAIANLTVTGTTTTLNSTQMTVADNVITLNSNVTGTPTLNAGIEVNRGNQNTVMLYWDEVNTAWVMNNGTDNYLIASEGGMIQKNQIVDFDIEVGTVASTVFTNKTLEDISNVNISSISNGQVLKWDTTTSKWVNGTVSSGGVSVFSGLTDVPGSYANQANYFVKVNSAANGLEFIQNPGYLTTVAFGDLTGKPTTLSGYGITDALSTSSTIDGGTF